MINRKVQLITKIMEFEHEVRVFTYSLAVALDTVLVICRLDIESSTFQFCLQRILWNGQTAGSAMDLTFPP